MTLALEHMILNVDFAAGQIAALQIGGKQRLHAPTALFALRVRDLAGNATVYGAHDATACTLTEDGAIYAGFALAGLCVQVHLADKQGSAAWRAEVRGLDEAHVIEWLDFPLLTLPALHENTTSAVPWRLRLTKSLLSFVRMATLPLRSRYPRI